MAIELNKLSESDKGREVRYDDNRGKTEFGYITSWNEQFIFVRYHTQHLHSLTGKTWSIPRTGSTSEATRPEDLEFCNGRAK